MVLIQEGEPLSSAARCCFCRKNTHFWVETKDVACCQSCARNAFLEDVPPKSVWCRRELIATHSPSQPPLLPPRFSETPA